MNQNRYFTNDSSSKPFTASEGIETKKYSGNPLLREVDEELRRLRSQFDKVASGTTSNINASSPPPPSNSYINFSNYYPSSSSPQGSRIDKVDEHSRPSYATDSFQQNSFSSGRQNYHKDAGKYGTTQAVGGTPAGMSSYGYQKPGSGIFNNAGSYATGSGNTAGFNANTTAQKTSGITKTGSNNGSFEFKSPKNLTSSGRHIQPSQQLQSQQSNISETSQPSQISPQQSSISTSSPLPVIEVTNNETFKLPATKPQVVRISSPQSQTIRINSPPKIRTGPTPAQIARNQQQARRKAQMQHIERERQLARQYQQQTTKIRQQKQKATNQRRQREQRESSISKNDLGNYVTNINDKNKKISELQSKINQMNYNVANAENQAKRYKIQMQSLKNNQKSQVDSLNNTINNLKRQIEILNRDKDRRNVDLENKINKINFSYEQVNATNNRLNREIENLKREVQRKSTNNEVNTNVFEEFKQKINEKTQRINELEKQLDNITDNRNQLTKRIDQLLLQGYEPKKEFSLQKLEKQPGAFDEILKMNLEENQTYKTNLAVKDEEIFRLEEVNRTLKWENDRMRNQIEIEKLKRMTELKNTQTTMDIEVQVKQNQINSLNHVITALEQKLKFIVQEDRKKDQFMVTYLKGRAEAAEEKQSVDEFFKQFELLSVNTNIAECLKREQLEIQKLKDEIQRMYKQRR